MAPTTRCRLRASPRTDVHSLQRLGTVSFAPVTVAVHCTSPAPGHDDFQRPDSGSLGTAWTAMNDGGMAISGGTAVGSSPAGTQAISGSARTTAATNTRRSSWVRPSSPGAVDRPGSARQNGGQDLYLGIYFWKNGSPSSISISAPAASSPNSAKLPGRAAAGWNRADPCRIRVHRSRSSRTESSGYPLPTARSPAETPAS